MKLDPEEIVLAYECGSLPLVEQLRVKFLLLKQQVHAHTNTLTHASTQTVYPELSKESIAAASRNVDFDVRTLVFTLLSKFAPTLRLTTEALLLFVSLGETDLVRGLLARGVAVSEECVRRAHELQLDDVAPLLEQKRLEKVSTGRGFLPDEAVAPSSSGKAKAKGAKVKKKK